MWFPSKSAGRLVAAALLAGTFGLGAPGVASPLDPAQVRIIPLPSSETSTVFFRVVVGSGAADDPPGREGAAWFTAHLMARGDAAGGTFSVSVGKDSIAFSGQAPRGGFDAWYAVVRDAVLRPAFAPEDLPRVRAEQIRAIERLRESDDALAGEALDSLVYRNHPYGHPTPGWLRSASILDRGDAAAFHAVHFVKGNVVVGIAGPASDAQVERVRADFAGLPDGQPTRGPRSSTALPSARVLVVERPGADRVTLRIGEPLTVSRFHTDFVPLCVAVASFGDAEMPGARLGSDLRLNRGLSESAEASLGSGCGGNDPWGSPEPGTRRRETSFSIRLAPKSINAKFALNLSLADLEDLAENGIPEGDIGAARSAVVRRHAEETSGPDRALAAAIDEAMEGATGFDERFAASAAAVTAPSVQAALKRQFSARRVAIVAVVPNAATFVENLLSSETVIEYPPGIAWETYRARDLDIVGMPGRLTRDEIEIVRSGEFFN